MSLYVVVIVETPARATDCCELFPLHLNKLLGRLPDFELSSFRKPTSLSQTDYLSGQNPSIKAEPCNWLPDPQGSRWIYSAQTGRR